MTPHYRVTPAADADLDAQALYLAERAGEETALRFYDAAAVSFDAIARMPGMGERWRSAKSRLTNVRIWRIQGFENHLIFYRPAADGVEIVRVLHGARDFTDLIDE